MRRLKIDDRKIDGCHCRELPIEKQASGLVDVVRRRIEGDSGGWGGGSGCSEPQSRSVHPLHGGQMPRTQGGFDLETELIIMPEAPKAQARCRR